MQGNAGAHLRVPVFGFRVQSAAIVVGKDPHGCRHLGCWLLGVGSWELGVGSWELGVGYHKFNKDSRPRFGFWVLGIGC